MPVRFLGGGGGGGTIDVKNIVSDPTLTTTSNTTETVVCSWTLPSNYLLAKDAINISLMGVMTLATSTNVPTFKVRLGTTGTTSDTLLTTFTAASGLWSSVANELIQLEHLTYFDAIGITGSCYSGGFIETGIGGSGVADMTTASLAAQTAQIINTTGILYITVTMSFASSGNTFTPKSAHLGMSF